MKSQVFICSGTASLAVHLALAAGLLFAEAHPFDYVSPEPIAVDIVSLKEISSSKKQTLSPEESRVSSTNAFDTPDDKPQADAKAAAISMQSRPSQASPQSQPAPSRSYDAPQPDISVKYGVLLGLPASGIGEGDGAAETTRADIPAMDTAQFRRHLKSCSKMPASVSPGDNIRIVLRVPFTTDGKIAAPPALIEASASTKGPALMKGAIEALVACQPYAMLPPDKYDEWKVLDLSFTPRDFVGG